MGNYASDNKRIAKNTVFLYFRTIVILLITLYTSRVVLKTLGVVDFGIYNVVGGVVALFGLVSGALSAAVTRFLNIEMGRSNEQNLTNIFSSAITIHIALAIIIIIIAEAIGPWFICNHMTIPQERITAALWVFHCSIITFAVNLFSVPYNACIIAHENMKVFAYISIVEAILKLLIVYVLLLLPYDKLAVYGILMLCVAIIIRIIYQIYCRKQYPESRFHLLFDWKMIRSMFGFASWNMLGSTSVLLADQGVNILLNIFCNPIVNAARGIAMQVNHAINSFSSNFMTALNPQITKKYGANDLYQYKQMMFNGSRFAMCLLTFISLPILVDTEYILHLWLEEVPEYSVNFVRLILLFSISESMSNTFTTGLLATGNIKKLMLTVAICRMMNFPLSYIGLVIFHQPEITILISICISQVNLLIRLQLLKSYIPVSIINYYIRIGIPLCLTLIIPFIVSVGLTHNMETSFLRFISNCFITSSLCLLCISFVICSKPERIFIRSKINTIIKEKLKRNN